MCSFIIPLLPWNRDSQYVYIPFIGVTISFETTNFTATEAEQSVEICVVIENGILGRNVDFTLSTSTDSATEQDFTPQNVTLSFTPSSSRECINILVIDDGIVEDTEEFVVSLGSGDSAVDVALGVLSVPILDSSSVLLRFMQDEYRLAENESVTVCVVLEGQNDRNVMVFVEATNSSTG